MTDLLSEISSLPPERRAEVRALLEQQLLRIRGKARAEGSLSFAQRRIWFLEQLDPDSRAYTISFALRLKGSLQIPALEDALGEIVRRHDPLRMRFRVTDGEPYVVLEPEAARPLLELIDLGGLTDAEKEAEVARHRIAEARRRFDLAEGPLFFARLLRLDATAQVLVFSIHHLIADAWSVGVLLRELASGYSARVAGGPSLPDLTTKYEEYASAQRFEEERGGFAEDLAYWTKKLSGSSPLELPFDRPRPRLQSFSASREVQRLSPELVERLHAFSRAENATLFMILLAAFQALLFRYSGQEDFAIGTATLGRDRSSLEGLIGLFVNTLVLRIDLSGRPSFRELLARVRAVSLEAFSHQSLPFERLVKEVHPERRFNRNPLFEVFFNMRSVSVASGTFEGLSVELLPTVEAAAAFDLSLQVDESARSLRCTWEYATDLFDAATVARIAAHFEALLGAALASPDLPVSKLSFLSAQDRACLAAPPVPARAPEAPGSIHAAVEAQARSTPDRIAVEGDRASGSLTYAELNREANRLARHLVGLGARRGALAGVCLERGPSLVVALLAVAKTGAAYLPLDPANPEARLGLMMADGSPGLVVTEEALADRFLALGQGGRAVVSIDRASDRQAIAAELSADLDVEQSPRDLAYVIYTSGSTGRPKGVEVEHAAVLNLLESMRHDLRFGASSGGEAEVLLSVTTIGFDIAGLELWLPLISGGRVVLTSRDVAMDAALLSARIASSGATWMQATPATWRMLVSANWSKSDLGILCGGEALDVDLAGELLERGRAVWNLYGPTETTIWSSVERLTKDGLSEWPWPVVSIGGPIADTRMCVVGPDDQVAPIGVPGELWIGGAGLARGYRGRPDLTAERFIQGPDAELEGRFYRTGDRARLLLEGRFQYLGRIDEQLKIRGFRVEPQEIERVLGEHPAVRECAVVPNGEGDARRLIAYVVSREGSPSPSSGALRAFVKERLPEHMVPSLFILSDSLLLTPNGKLDRRALAALPLEQPKAEDRAGAPRDALEDTLLAIFSAVLDRDHVGIEEDFFALGGHSLLAVKLAGRIERELGHRPSLMAIFRAPTVAQLASTLREDDPLRFSARPLPPLVPASREGELPLSFSQIRLWFIDQLEGENGAYNIPLAFRLSGALDEKALAESLGEIVRRHEVLRTHYLEVEGRPVQAIGTPAPFGIEKVDLRSVPDRDDAVRHACNQEETRRFDLAHDVLLRARLLDLGREERVLLLTLHHIAADGWSLGILERELSWLYAALTKGLPPPLAPLPIQYVDYAGWQRSSAAGEAVQAELAYWRTELADAPQLLELPADRPRPPVQRFHGAIEHFALSPVLSARLKAFGRSSGATLFMTLLAGFAALLSRISEEEDIVIGSPIAKRSLSQTEPLIGCFLNTLALRVRVRGEESARRLLEAVRRKALEAYAHQDVPFEQVIEALQPKRDLSHSPLFQVMFILQNTPEGGLDLPGIRAGKMEREGTTAKYDLTLGLTDAKDGIQGGFEYNTDLFDPGTIRGLARHFEVLLEAIAADPDRPIASLPLLDEDERRRALVEWNQTAAPYPERATLVSLFEARVEAARDKTALIFGGRQLTFGELGDEADRIARRLRALGVGPEVLAGIAVERSIEMIAGLFGILKAGGAYLPLDPSLPRDRLAFMIEDARIPLIVTVERVKGSLPATEARLFSIDQEDSDGGVIPPILEDRLPAVEPGNAAYAIYTSGSTGRPKGVVGLHRGAVNRLHWMAKAYPFGEGEVCCQKTALGFVDSLAEICGPLLEGVPLVIIPDPVLKDPHAFVRTLSENQVTRLVLVPSLLGALLDHITDLQRRLPRLRLWVTSGEALQTELVERFKEAMPGATLLNLYGSSEDSGDVTFYDAGLAPPGLPVPIGRPIANTKLYVLDKNREPVPIGLPGELYVGGAGLARGYLHRDELTAERFVVDPFGAGGSGAGRLFKTGDRVRYRANGNLDYLGRADHQRKVRGFRVELGEVEGVLGEHPEIRQAAVIAPRGAGGEMRLVAFYSGANRGAPSAEELREFSKQKLPDYMVPAAFIRLDAVPLTASGKIDRPALSGLAIEPARESPFVPPRDALESKLIEIWQKLLERESIGVGDDFFDLGGHSLLVVKLADRIENVLGRRLPLMSIFRAPTIAGLATLLRDPDALKTSWRALEPLQTEGTRPPLFFIGSTAYARVLAAAIGPDQPFYAFNLFGLEHRVREGEPLDLVSIARTYVEELRTVQPHGPYRLSAYCGDSAVAYEMALQLRAAGQEIALFAVIDTSSLAPRRLTKELKGTLQSAIEFGPRYLLHRLERRVTHVAEHVTLLASRILIRELPRFGVQPSLWLEHQRVVRGFDRAIQQYVPKPYDGRITRIQSREWRLRDLARGLAPSMAAEVRVLEVPGYHDRLFEEPQVGALGALLRRCLDEAADKSREPR